MTNQRVSTVRVLVRAAGRQFRSFNWALSAASVLSVALTSAPVAATTNTIQVAPCEVPDEQPPRINPGDAPTGFGPDSWQGPASGKSNWYAGYIANGDKLSALFPADAATLKISDLAAISYFTKRPVGTPASRDWWIIIYTRPTGVHDKASWYHDRYINNYGAHTETAAWTQYSTASGMTFVSNGWGGEPVMSLTDLITAHGGDLIGAISIQTDSGWGGFNGYIDGLEITLTNGNIGQVNLGSALTADDRYVTATGGIDGTNTCLTSTVPCATIQRAVNVACAGGTVRVAAGTYTEQVEISKALTVSGTGVPIIQSPASLPLSFTTSAVNKPVVYVHGADNVTIKGLTVDGLGRGNANYRFVGIAYYDAGGHVTNVEIKNIKDTPFSGNQHGNGIYAYSTAGTARSLEVDHVNVHDFQKTGIVCAGANLSSNIHDNTVTGIGDTAVTAQNGIQVSSGAQGVIAQNTVSGIAYTGPSWGATAILTFGAGGTLAISDNIVSNSMFGINVDTAAAITGNHITGHSLSDWGIIAYGPATISGNVIASNYVAMYTEATVGITGNTITGFDGVSDYGIYTTGSSTITGNTVSGISGAIFLEPSAGTTMDVGTNTLSGGAVAGSVGLYIYAPLVASTIGVSCNRIDGWENGVVSQAPSSIPTISSNSITGNATGIFNSSGVVNAQGNWWGCAAGPGNPGCDSVTAGVNVSPPLSAPPTCAPCATNAECNDGNPCTVDTCSGTCSNTAGNLGALCRAGSGDACDPDEVCDGVATACPADVVQGGTFTCYGGYGTCDPAQTCTGIAGQECPLPNPLPAGTQCYAGSGDMCDPVQRCSGVAGLACPAPSPLPNTTTCYTGSGDMCDADKKCTGAIGAACPAATTQPNTVTCYAGSGDICDPAKQCPGAAHAACPAHIPASAGTICRASGGDCDPSETCDGTGSACPANSKSTAGTVCRPVGSLFFQGFEVDASQWFDVTRVASGVDGVASKSGGFHADTAPADGPFTRWGGYNAVFPAGGYTTSVDVYLNTAGGFANDTKFDFSSAINGPLGAHRRDFIFSVGFYDDATAPCSGNCFVVSASNNSPGWPKNPGRSPYPISTSGWYTFQHRFYDAGGGVLAVDLSVRDASGTELHRWTLSDPSDIIGTTVGGNRYGWFVYSQFPFLAIDNSERSQDAPCDVAEVCDGSSVTCPVDAVPPAATTVCRAGSGDSCDPDEYCDGTSKLCPADVVAPSTSTCYAGSGDACDPVQKCTGVTGQACPAPSPQPAGTTCYTGSGDQCDPDKQCTGAPGASCPAATTKTNAFTCYAGSGDVCDPVKKCPGAAHVACPAPSTQPGGTTCYTGSGDQCDPDKQCTGAPGATCPAAIVKPNTFTCYDGSGDVCDPVKKCPGAPHAACPPHSPLPLGTTCYNGSGDMCDPVQKCDGTPGDHCPAPAPVTSVCHAGSGDVCDPSLHCPGTTGLGGHCPAAIVKPNTFTCYAGSGDECDPAKKCPGTAAQRCPAPTTKTNNTQCTSSALICGIVDDTCQGGICTQTCDPRLASGNLILRAVTVKANVRPRRERVPPTPPNGVIKVVAWLNSSPPYSGLVAQVLAGGFTVVVKNAAGVNEMVTMASGSCQALPTRYGDGVLCVVRDGKRLVQVATFKPNRYIANQYEIVIVAVDRSIAWPLTNNQVTVLFMTNTYDYRDAIGAAPAPCPTCSAPPPLGLCKVNPKNPTAQICAKAALK